jgi:hypothetical protein
MNILIIFSCITWFFIGGVFAVIITRRAHMMCKLAFLVLCAAAANVMLTWAFSISDTPLRTITASPPNTHREYESPATGSGWHCSQWDALVSNAVWRQPIHPESRTVRHPVDAGPAWSRVQTVPTHRESRSYNFHMELAYGWPRRCLIAEYESTPAMIFTKWDHVSGFQLPLSDHTFGVPRTLPIKPIWSGFVVNTTLWCVLLLPMIPIMKRLKRRKQRMRLARGLCPHCRYPLGASETCPECGGALPPVKDRPVVPPPIQ